MALIKYVEGENFRYIIDHLTNINVSWLSTTKKKQGMLNPPTTFSINITCKIILNKYLRILIVQS